MNEYKTFEELKEELGNKYDKYMYQANIELLNKIDKAIECVKDFLCTEKYISLDGEAIANNYHELLQILGGDVDE